MANQSFSYVHPCDSALYTNKMLNDERNDSGTNTLNMENQKLARNQPHHHQHPHHSLFNNDTVDLYEYQPILPSKDSYLFDSSNRYSSTSTKFAQSSRSVPSSRRNSNEKDNSNSNSSSTSSSNNNTKQSLESLFNSKLQLGPTDQSMPSIPDSSAFLANDGSFGKSSQRPSLAPMDSSLRHHSQQLSTPTDMSNTYALNAASETMMSPFAFDQDNSGANPIFHDSPHLSQNHPVYQRQPTSFVTPNDYGDLFAMQKSSARHNKSLESLRSKSWTQYLDQPTPNGAYLHRAVTNGNNTMEPPAFDDYRLPSPANSRVSYGTATESAFYNPTPPRRSSYGWPNSDSNRYQGFSPDLANIKNRLTTSQSHSDLRGVGFNEGNNQHPGSTAAASFGFYNGSSDVTGLGDLPSGNSNEQQASSLPLCPQYMQFLYCSLGDQCQYYHPIMQPTTNEQPAPSSSPKSQQHHSPTLNPLHPSAAVNPVLYSSYHPMNPLFNSSAALLNNSGMPTSSANNISSLPVFPVGASSSVYGRTNNALPFQPSPPSHQQQQLYKQQQQQQQQQQVQQFRRSSSSEQDSSRFMNASLEDFSGHLYELAKDQNGCRFLQRKIEDTSQNNNQAITAIYEEIHGHFVELMTNSFGNYLCQKLLERCNNEQRNKIIEIVAPDIVNISLNMHGTRAVQKLIEFLSTPDQIHMITSALNPSVVPLIKDLNGNHVIQKCLHRLSAEHRQFIYDAVSDKCIQVATHKHGCCVLQRCIDYASAAQKAQLVEEITRHALPLVQDPYGNYVVQYVLELGDPHFSDALIRRFVGHTCYLSAQKFSSNVIEKCIRVASPETRKLLIAEFIDPPAMEKLLRDSFANYVIQTSLDCAEVDQRAELVDCIRPLLVSVKSTPYGKRIHGKIFHRDQQRTSSQPLYSPRQQQTSQNRRSFNSST